MDRAIVEVPVAEELVKTKRGLFRPESGVVRCSLDPRVVSKRL